MRQMSLRPALFMRKGSEGFMRTSTFSPSDYLSDAAREFLARRMAEIIGLALIGGTVVVFAIAEHTHILPDAWATWIVDTFGTFKLWMLALLIGPVVGGVIRRVLGEISRETDPSSDRQGRHR